MEAFTVVVILAASLVLFKLFAFLFKTSLFVITLPFQIIGIVVASLLTLLVIAVVVPFAILTGVLAVIFAPFLALGPILPVLLVLFGIYLLARRRS